MARVGALVTPFIAQVKTLPSPGSQGRGGEGEAAVLMQGPNRGRAVCDALKQGCCCLVLEDSSGSPLDLPLSPLLRMLGAE